MARVWRAVRWLCLLVLLMAAILWGAWFTLPRWAPVVLPALVEDFQPGLPVQIRRMAVARPHGKQLYLPELTLRLEAGAEVTIRHLSLQWRPEASPESPRLALVAETVEVTPDAQAARVSTPQGLPTDALAQWQALLDRAREYVPVLVIDRLAVQGVPALAGATLQLSWSLDAPIGLRLVHPQGRVELKLSQLTEPLEIRAWPVKSPIEQVEARGRLTGGDWGILLKGRGGLPDQPLQDWTVRLQSHLPGWVSLVNEGWPDRLEGEVKAALTWKGRAQGADAHWRLEPDDASVSLSLEPLQAGGVQGTVGAWWPLGGNPQPVLAFDLAGGLDAWQHWIPDGVLHVPRDLTLTHLKVQGALRLPAGTKPLQGRGRLEADGVVWTGSGVAMVDGRVETDWAVSGKQMWTPEGLRVTIPEVIAAVPVQQVEGRLRIKVGPDTCQLDISTLAGRIFDGRFRLAQPVQTACSGWPEEPMYVELRDLSLRELVAMENKAIQATGRISGVLPVRVSGEGVTVSGGQVAASEPGELHVPDSLLGTLTRDNAAMLIALGPLKNYHYTVLRSQVDYDDKGFLRLSLQLQGRDPVASEARPVHYNLNIQSNIMELLRSTEYVNQVQARIQERLSRP